MDETIAKLMNKRIMHSQPEPHNALISESKHMPGLNNRASYLLSFLGLAGWRPWVDRLMRLPGSLSVSSDTSLCYWLASILRRCRQTTTSLFWNRSDRDRGSENEAYFMSATPVVLRLERYRDFCLRERKPNDEQQVASLGEELRAVRNSSKCSRSDLARLLTIDLELLVAVENGYGNLDAVQSLMARARKLLASYC